MDSSLLSNYGSKNLHAQLPVSVKKKKTVQARNKQFKKMVNKWSQFLTEF